MSDAQLTAGQQQTPRDRIVTARDKWDSEALTWQRRVRRLGRCAALLVPVAVFLLTLQVLAFPQKGAVAVSLIAAELLLLFAAILIGLVEIGPSPADWI